MSLSDALPTAMLGAATAIAPMLQARQQHGKELEVTHELHRTAISQAERHHETELDVTKTLHHEAVNHARNLQYEALGHSEKLHKHGVKHSEKLHREGLGLSTRLHLEALQQELAHHLQQMAHDTETARRENLRDVWSQRNRKAETLMITNTLMFGCFFAMIVEGMPHPDSSLELVIVYSVAVSLSFCFLFLCMWFTMKTQARMTKFNMYNPKQMYTCGSAHHNFEDYYRCHAERPAKIAQHCFYYGTISLVCAASCLVFSRMRHLFNVEAGGITFVAVVGLTSASLVVLHFMFPTSTRLHGPEDDIPAARLYAGDFDPHEAAERLGMPQLSRKMTFTGSLNAALDEAAQRDRERMYTQSPPYSHTQGHASFEMSSMSINNNDNNNSNNDNNDNNDNNNNTNSNNSVAAASTTQGRPPTAPSTHTRHGLESPRSPVVPTAATSVSLPVPSDPSSPIMRGHRIFYSASEQDLPHATRSGSGSGSGLARTGPRYRQVGSQLSTDGIDLTLDTSSSDETAAEPFDVE